MQRPRKPIAARRNSTLASLLVTNTRAKLRASEMLRCSGGCQIFGSTMLRFDCSDPLYQPRSFVDARNRHGVDCSAFAGNSDMTFEAKSDEELKLGFESSASIK